MNDVKTWADIDASPLLQLPPEQRKKLHDANDERFRTFWAECFLTAQTPGRGEARLIADRCTNKEIAAKMFLSEGTVKQYTNQLYSKLGIGGGVRTKRAQLAELFAKKY